MRAAGERAGGLFVRGARTTVAGVLLVVLGAGGALVLRSPDESIVVVPPTVLTAPVESRVLQSEVTGTGVITPAGTVTVRVTPPEGTSAVVTGAPIVAGAPVPWCRPVVEVSGRPVIVLRGSVPGYRDLTVGDSGSDVRQLQSALRACGYRIAVDGELGAATAAAVASLYRDAGFVAVTASADGLGPAGGGAVATPVGAQDATVPASRVVAGPGAEAPAAEESDSHAGDPARPPVPVPTPRAQPAIVLPRAEVVYLPDDARAGTVGGVGSSVEDVPAATLVLGGESLAVNLSATQRAEVSEGLPVELAADGWAVTVPLPALPDVATTDESGLPTYPVLVPLGPTAPTGATGQVGTFRVLVGSPEPYPLVVPVSALHQETDGRTVLRRPTASGEARVVVRVVAAAGGYSAVDVLDGSDLGAGDEVVIGG